MKQVQATWSDLQSSRAQSISYPIPTRTKATKACRLYWVTVVMKFKLFTITWMSNNVKGLLEG